MHHHLSLCFLPLDRFCGDQEEDGILVPSPSYTVGPAGGIGAGIAEFAECGWTDAGDKAKLWEELTLFLVVFL